MPVLRKALGLFVGSAMVVGLVGCDGGKEPVAEVPPQQPVLQSELEQFSYSVGVILAQDMINKGMTEIDEAAMGMGIRDALDGKEPRLSEEQMETALEQATQRMLKARLEQANAVADKAKQAGEKYLAENAAKEGVTTLPSGVQYKVLTEGSGEKPTLESTVVAHYHGSLIDGSVFDSSYERGTPATFALARVVKGWQEVLPLMSTGSKWQVAIPSELAYGEDGAPPRIGGNETLLFDIELIEVKQ